MHPSGQIVAGLDQKTVIEKAVGEQLGDFRSSQITSIAPEPGLFGAAWNMLWGPLVGSS
ncbi:MAG: hypothetical protein U0800_07995 [Isosphaeraceae bacterium]